MRVDYLGLEAFVAVAELGSFSKAAQRLNLTQTALSHRVRKIEEDLGTKLLIRNSREVSLTIAGQALLPKVREQLQALAGLYTELRETGRETMQRLLFACVPTIANAYLPRMINEFARAHPDVQIVMLDQPAAVVTRLVLEGVAEFGITITGATPWDVEAERLCVENYVLMVARNHPLSDRETVTRHDLIGEPMVRIRTQQTNRQLIDDSLGEVSRRIDWRFEVQNAATALRLVGVGAAVTVLPRSAQSLAPDNIVLLPFSDVELSRDVVSVYRRGVPLSPSAETLLGKIRKRLETI